MYEKYDADKIIARLDTQIEEMTEALHAALSRLQQVDHKSLLINRLEKLISTL